MNRFLLDANLSPITANYLRETFDLDVVHLLDLGKPDTEDEDVVELAKRERRIVKTFDLDFGELFHRREHGTFGVIVLRLDDQKSSTVNRVLGRFFAQEAASISLERSLVLIEQD